MSLISRIVIQSKYDQAGHSGTEEIFQVLSVYGYNEE